MNRPRALPHLPTLEAMEQEWHRSNMGRLLLQFPATREWQEESDKILAGYGLPPFRPQLQLPAPQE